MPKKKKYSLSEEDLYGTAEETKVEEPIMNEPVEEVQNTAKQPEVIEKVVEVQAPVEVKREEPKPSPVAVQQMPTERVETRGRKKDPNTKQPKLLSVNIVDLEDDLDILVTRYKKEHKDSSFKIGAATYVRELIEKDIEQNKEYINKAKAFFA